MEQNKERWIEDVLQSAGKIGRAAAPGGLEEKVFVRLREGNRPVEVSLPIGRWAAAAVLLIVLNVGSIMYASSRQAPADKVQDPLTSDLVSGNQYSY
jgi:hypothetical protein